MSSHAQNIILLSDSCMRTYPSNKPENFTNQLFSPIEINDYYEVGLTSIVYPNTWDNLFEECKFILVISYNDGYGRTRTTESWITISAGYYASIQDLCLAVQKETRRVIDANYGYWAHAPKFQFDISYNLLTQRCTISLDKGDATLRIIYGTQLFRYLGFENEVNQILALPAEGKNQANIAIHLPALFVYCNLVMPQLVGDTSCQLLRIIPVHGKHDTFVNEKFENPNYIQINTGYINSISLKICSDTGAQIAFKTGPIIASLRLRKCGITE